MTRIGFLAIKQTQVTADAEIRELVGDVMYHDIKYAMSYRGLDSKVTHFENRLADCGFSPLSPEQRDVLQTAYRSITHPQVPGEEKNPVIGGQHGPETDVKVEALVATILSPEQFAALKAYHRDDRAETEIFSRVNKAVHAASVQANK